MKHESLCAEIDYAERCLVSALYDNALTSSTSTLCKLCKELDGVVFPCTEDGNGQTEDVGQQYDLTSMIEAAGMVLVQALSQMGRPSDIFHELVAIFGSVANIPYVLLFNGSCLQLSRGFPLASAKILEEYLRLWYYPGDDANENHVRRPSRNAEDLKHDYHIPESSIISAGASHWFSLSRADYLNLVEVYLIDVLARSYRDSRAAHVWVQKSTLSEGDKAVTLAKLRLAFQSEMRRSNSTLESKSKGVSKVPIRTGSDPAQEPKQATQTLATSDARQSMSTLTSQDSRSESLVTSRLFWKVPFMTSILKVIRLIMNRLGWVSRRGLSAGNLPPKNTFLTRAVTVLVVSALLRKRQNVARLILQAGSIGKIYCMDLWQLAFSIHLNPLAAG